MEEDARKAAVEALSKIDPAKPYGTKLFDAKARVSVSVAVEAVCLRRGDNGLEVFLRQRSLDDKAYPGQWYCPGSIMRPGESQEDVFARLEEKEFGSSITDKRFVGILNNKEEARGHVFSVLYLCGIDWQGRSDCTHKWCSVSKLPSSTVGYYRDEVIPKATKAFLGI